VVRNDASGRSLPISDVVNANLDTLYLGLDTVYQLNQVFTGAALSSCSTGTSFGANLVSFEVLMSEVGGYRVTKELRLINMPASAYLSYLDSLGQLPDSSAWVQFYLNQVDTTLCDIVGTANDSIYRNTVSTAYNNRCEGIYQQIRQQVAAGGVFNISVVDGTCADAHQYLTINSVGDTVKVKRFGAGITVTTMSGIPLSVPVTIENRTDGSIFNVVNWTQYWSATNPLEN
jgi:hypothetical protein